MMLTLENWTYVVGLGGAATVLIRWFYRIARRIETIFNFVERLESNHLNHIYERLGRIERSLGIKDDNKEDGDGSN